MESGSDSRLAAALSRLVDAGTLTPEQAAAVRREMTTTAGPHPAAGEPARSWTGVLAEVGGYVGAAFVLGAILVLTGPHWDALSHGTRVVVLVVPAVLLAVAAWWIDRPARPARPEGARGRLVSVLVLVAGGSAAAAGAELSGGNRNAVAAAVALAAWAVGYVLVRGTLLQLAVPVGTAWLVFAWADRGEEQVAVAGLVLVVAAAAWAVLAVRGRLADAEVGVISAGILGFVGAEAVIVADGELKPAGYLALAIAVVAGLAWYVLVKRTAALIVGTLTLAVLVPQFVLDVTDGALGAGGALLVTGLSIVGASGLGLRLRRDVPGGSVPAGH